MGNGASCGENARDVGADEELNPMLMGDADKENHYRRPSVPHVQAVRVRRPPVITAFFREKTVSFPQNHRRAFRRRSGSSASPL